MIPPQASPDQGRFFAEAGFPLVCGSQADLRLIFEAGSAGLPAGSRIRIGLPNTGWDRPVVPQQRYWDELASAASRRLAPFHPVNTTAAILSRAPAWGTLEVMERMLVPDEDPALAYWRWWITFTLEGSALEPGDRVEILYGDLRFGVATRIQTFPEPHINITAYLQTGGAGPFLGLTGSPFYLDVIAGPAERANVVVPSVSDAAEVCARIALTDACHCAPAATGEHSLQLGASLVVCRPGRTATAPVAAQSRAVLVDGTRVWGVSNPSVPRAGDGLSLYWGDLHAQSEHHVMHSQKMDFRQAGWSKGISCGTLDECYSYARQVSLLDFVAITDQGACLTDRWEYCQEKVREYHCSGEFVVFKGYEAGSPLGHRNVIYCSDEIDPPLDATRFNTFHPDVVFAHYRGREDVLIIPHHVKTWTDWKYHDPELEPLMEIYSCWGQSESPGLELWNKGQTPGAGAWEAFRRGYRMGMVASSDNHVGMPGRSYPGDRQIHTPFPGGLCAVWAEEQTRESIFRALRERRCYGTTGARLIVKFHIGGRPMGAILRAEECKGQPLSVMVAGTAPLDRVEIVRNLEVWRILRPAEDTPETLQLELEPAAKPAMFYLRVFQQDGQRAWTSPIWLE
ncbi:MAG TPA: CehA/McbA family metallohydrolase [Bryobacteraceae bacterium]|nr:CehA/McbA family metallohydrolase [Bryobacteraceae bacterium]